MHVICVAVDVVVDVLVSVDVVAAQEPHSAGHAPLTRRAISTCKGAAPLPPNVQCDDVKLAQFAPSSLPLQVRTAVVAVVVEAFVHVWHLHGDNGGRGNHSEAVASARKLAKGRRPRRVEPRSPHPAEQTRSPARRTGA